MPPPLLRRRGAPALAALAVLVAVLVWSPRGHHLGEPVRAAPGRPASAAADVPAAAPVEPARVVLWGDSLAWEARLEFRRAIAAAGHEVLERTYGGVAPCDALPDVVAAARSARPPDAAVLAFTGNNLTPCTADVMTGAPLEGDALVERYRHDLLVASRALRAAGAHVWLVAPPASATSDVPRRIAALVAELAATEPGVAVVDGGRDLTPGGVFVPELRSPDGVHLCPVEYRLGEACPVPSPGAQLYADAMAEPVLAALGVAASSARTSGATSRP